MRIPYLSLTLLGARLLLASGLEAQSSNGYAKPPLSSARDTATVLLKSSGNVLIAAPLAEASGEATYYADKFEGRRTASGIVFSNAEPYAAHREYPFGTIVRVTNPMNDRSVILRVVDRGPNGTAANKARTIIDVSKSAAKELDLVRYGRLPVKVEVLEWGSGRR